MEARAKTLELLRSLGCEAIWSDMVNDCPGLPICADGSHVVKGTHGSRCHVTSGCLAGATFSAWGDSASNDIFQQVVVRLEALWDEKFEDVKLLGAALRSINH